MVARKESRALEVHQRGGVKRMCHQLDVGTQRKSQGKPHFFFIVPMARKIIYKTEKLGRGGKRRLGAEDGFEVPVGHSSTDGTLRERQGLKKQNWSPLATTSGGQLAEGMCVDFKVQQI